MTLSFFECFVVAFPRYYLGAATRRLSEEVKFALVVSCYGTIPAEAWTKELLEDDRFLLNASRMWSLVLRQMQFVEGLDDSFFSVLITSLGLPVTVTEMKSHVLQCCTTSCGYLRIHAYEQLESGIFRFTQGDIGEKLRVLVAGPRPVDEEEGRVHFCATFWPGETHRALLLLQQAPTSIALVERGHAAGALVRRAHHLIGSSSLASRAFLCEARPLCRSITTMPLAAWHRNEFERCVEASKRVRFNARNAFVSHSLASCHRFAANESVATRRAASQACVAQHNAAFDRLCPAKQAALGVIARHERQKRSFALLEQAQRHWACARLEDRPPGAFGIDR